jgi:hypothetical protein
MNLTYLHNLTQICLLISIYDFIIKKSDLRKMESTNQIKEQDDMN